MDILIYAKPKNVEHKMQNKVDRDIEYCYWTISTYPSDKNEILIEHVYFSNGERIYAKGKFTGCDYECPEGKKIIKLLCFKPLERVDIKQPKKPPTRGWCYININ